MRCAIHRRRPIPRLSVERLESRRLLASVRVSTDSDLVDFGGAQTIADLPGHDEVVSLREAIIATNNTRGADQIRFLASYFNVPRTIYLQLGQLTITDALTIEGPAADRLAIQQVGSSRVFNIDDGVYPDLLPVGIGGVTITGGVLMGTSEDGAGIRNRENLTLTDVVVTGNGIQGIDGRGAGISTRDAMLSISSSTIAFNWADAFNGALGGGIYTNNHLGGVHGTTIVNSTVSGNVASGGGGIFNHDGLTYIANCTITDNYGSYYAGGVASYADSDTRTRVVSSIISGNRDYAFPNSDVTLWGNQDNSFVTGGNNLIGSGTGATAFSPYLGDQVGVNNPGLLPLAWNGGPTPTHAILGTSPAMDRGSNPLALPFDQRGAPFLRRDSGFPPDVGAHEWQTITSFPRPQLIVDTAVDELDGDYSLGDVSLREAINAANGFVYADSILFDTGGVFSTPQTIGLCLGELWISDSTTVGGPGASWLTIDGQGMSRVLRVNRPTGATDPIGVQVSGLTISGGWSLETFNWGGGGVLNLSENLTLYECVISDNFANAPGGGVSSPGGSGQLTLTRSVVSGNSSLSRGGGVYLSNARSTIYDSTISNNSAANGGGGLYSDSLDTTVRNTTISGNSGGGMLIYPFGTRIQNTTVTQNTDGGLLVITSGSQGLEINSTIIAGNLPVDVHLIGGENPLQSLGYNLIGVGNLAFAFVGPSDMANILDPGLDALAYNGGPTPTHALRPDSLARDHGSNPFGLVYDQRGAPYARVVGPQADVGAFEAPLGLRGDFNHDGVLDCADVNDLVFAIVNAPQDLAYDLSGNGEVNTDDLDLWLAIAGAAPGSPTGGDPFLAGDANLDGVVDGQDFIAWNSHKFTNIAAWCAGDFTADGVVDGQDFIVWNSNKFQSADAPERPAVPFSNVSPVVSPLKVLHPNGVSNIGQIDALDPLDARAAPGTPNERVARLHHMTFSQTVSCLDAQCVDRVLAGSEYRRDYWARERLGQRVINQTSTPEPLPKPRLGGIRARLEFLHSGVPDMDQATGDRPPT